MRIVLWRKSLGLLLFMFLSGSTLATQKAMRGAGVKAQDAKSVMMTPAPAIISAPAELPARPTSARFKTEIKSQVVFDSLARVYTDAAYPLPHVMFVIDRRAKNKIYYVNTQRYRFHREFVNGNYLSLDRGDEFQRNYTDPKRRFLLGSVAYQTPVKRWTFEFWEGDTADAELIRLTHEVINRTFFSPVSYKPNSLRQEEASANLKEMPRVLLSDIAGAQEYQPLNLARGIGRIHVIDKLDDTVEIGSNEIVVLSEVPLSLPPVAGIIISKPSTPLSHINLLAKQWGVPNAYIKNANDLFRPNHTWWMSFETTKDGYKIKRAGIDQIKEYQERMGQLRDRMRPSADLGVTRLASLREQRKDSVIAYGAKSANLGEVANARIPEVVVPNGFTIPFYYYDQFIKENNLEEPIIEMLENYNFVHNPAYRRDALKKLRAMIQGGRINLQLAALVTRRVRAEHAAGGVFVRSSSNTEDLPNFSGAGLYDTVPNVRGEQALLEAIKTVWASLWKFEAYEARERAGVDHTKVYMAVLIQDGINAETAGVMITVDPFDLENRGATYISAKKGLGIRVVEGKKVAEQILYDPQTKATKVLTRSGEDSLLTFDEKGGVIEVPTTGDRAVLTDDFVRRLAEAATRIKRVFGGREQDIEWVGVRGQIYIVQSRPYIGGN